MCLGDILAAVHGHYVVALFEECGGLFAVRGVVFLSLLGVGWGGKEREGEEEEDDEVKSLGHIAR